MAALTPRITLPPLDPNSVIQGLSRAMVGVLRSGPITLDQDYGEYARWLTVGVEGSVSLVKWDGTTEVYSNLLPGLYPYCSIRINSSGTTATGLTWGS